MASKTQKVITPENLGQGIAYNPQTKKWEVHFVSEAEIEQVTNYVEPQEDDDHYVAKECIKLRDRTSGYMWDSCKATLKDRAPARDEEATINAEIVTGSGTPYVRIFDVTSNIDGTGVAGDYEYERDLSRFNTTKEYNDFIKDKKIKLVTSKRFAETLEGKPMIRSTTLEAAYPVMQERTEERTWSFTNADAYLDVYSGGRDHWDAVYQSGKLTIKLITQESGKQPVETDITRTFDLGGTPNRIAYDNGFTNTETTNIKIQFVPSTVVVKKFGYTITANFVNFDNGVVVEQPAPVEPVAPTAPEGISNIYWANDFDKLSDKNYSKSNGRTAGLLNYHIDSSNADSNTLVNLSQFANAKEANEYYKNKGVEASTGDDTVTLPWIKLPYIDTEISLDPLKQANRGAQGGFWDSLNPITNPEITEDEKREILRALKSEAKSINVQVRVSDKETGSEILSFTQTPQTYRSTVLFKADTAFRSLIEGEGAGKELTVSVSTDPVTIKWWNGKVDINFKPYDVIWSNGSGKFE